MSDLDLLLDLHVRNDRQGPGGDAQTRQALAIAQLDDRRQLEVADIGCGTGASTLILASELNANVAAVDFAAPFIERLSHRAAAARLNDKIQGCVANMAQLPFADQQLDVIWSEGSIYNVGFEAGLRMWRRFLKPGGIIAASDLTWTTPRRPAELESHWTSQYPSIETAPRNIERIERAGYAPLGFFFLPKRCWEHEYYAPLRANFEPFLERHDRCASAQAIIHAEEEEISLFEHSGEYFNYGFYIARKVDPAMHEHDAK